MSDYIDGGVILGQQYIFKDTGLKSTTLDTERRFSDVSLAPWTDGYILYNGTIGSDNERAYSSRVLCEPGMQITYKAETDHQTIAGITFWDAAGTLKGNVRNNGSYTVEHTVTVPDGACYFRLSTKKNKVAPEDCYAKISPTYYEMLDRANVNILDKIAGYVGVKWIKGKYLKTDGMFGTDSSRYITEPIACVPGQTVRYKAETNKTTLNAISFYDTRNQYIIGYRNLGSYDNEYSVIVPNNATSFRIGANDASIAPANCYAVLDSQYIKALGKLASERVYFVATNGNDSNTGTHENYPLATISKALELGARTIIVSPGTYNESIILSDTGVKREELSILSRIYPYSTGQHIPKVILSAAHALTFSANDGLMECTYSAASTTMLYKCFVSQSVNIVDSSSARSTGYKCNLWDGDTKLTPVLSLQSCGETANSWYYDGSKLYANTTGTALTLDDGDSSARISIANAAHVKLQGIVVQYGTGGDSISFSKCNNVELIECEANYNGLGNGFYAIRSNAVYNRCSAKYNRNDGFNYDGNGYTQFFDCSASHNFDDGISHHGACNGYICGGDMAYNGKGGISPVYLSEINIDNVYSHHNTYGLLVDGSGTIRVFNVVLKSNGNDLKVTGKTVNIYNSAYSSTDIDQTATLNVLD